MLANLAIAYLVAGILKSAFCCGTIHGYVRAGHSSEWNRLNGFPRPVVVVTLAFYALCVVVAWPFHRLPHPDTTEVRFGGVPKPKA